MKNKKTILVSLGVIPILLISMLFVSCAQSAPSPTSPTTIPPKTQSSTATTAPTTIAPITPTPSKPAPTPAVQVIKVKIHAHDAASSTAYKAFVRIVDFIEVATDGRLDFTTYSGGELIPSTEHLQAVKTGALDMAYSTGANWAGAFPEAALEWGLPTTVKDISEMYDLWYRQGWLQLQREAYTKNGAYLVGVRGAGGTGLWAKKPVRTIADLKGLKIRASGGTGALLDKLGAASTFIPFSEGYTALQLGTIDGFSTAPFQYRDAKHYEVCKYIMVPQIGRVGTGCIIANPAFWGKVPKDLQAIIELGVSRMFIEIGMIDVEDSDMMLMNEVPSLGGQIVEMDSALQAALAGGIVEYLRDQAVKYKDSNVPAIVELIVKYMKLQGYVK